MRWRVCSSSAARNAPTASSSWSVPVSRWPRRASALPRLFSVAAHRRGTRSRVSSLRASWNAATAFCESTRAGLPVAKAHERVAEIGLYDGPAKGHPLASVFLQRLAKGRDGLLELICAALSLAKAHEHITQADLSRRPAERHPFAGLFLERLAVGNDRGLELRRTTLALAKERERIGETELRAGPIKRVVFPGIGRDGCLQCRHRLL